VKKADVPVGGGVIMQNANFVVTQPTAGTYKAFSNVCTHQGCPVSEITNGAIVCTCHGSLFSVKDGSAISGPARRALAAATVTQSGDSLVIS
jgi:Rieske Fe-S protein